MKGKGYIFSNVTLDKTNHYPVDLSSTNSVTNDIELKWNTLHLE